MCLISKYSQLYLFTGRTQGFKIPIRWGHSDGNGGNQHECSIDRIKTQLDLEKIYLNLFKKFSKVPKPNLLQSRYFFKIIYRLLVVPNYEYPPCIGT